MKTALVLSGGAVKGAFETGFCNHIAKRGFKPDFILGTSIGAVNGALLADGEDFKENAKRTKKYWLNIRRRDLLTLNKKAMYKLAWSDSLLSHQGFTNFLNKNLTARRFDELSISLYINTTHYKDGHHKVFSEGTLLPALMASLSTPPIFPPVKINNHYYIDGGINSNSLVKEAKDCGAKRIIFVNLHRHNKVHKKENLFSHLSYLFHLMEKNIAHRERPHITKNVVEVGPTITTHNNYLDFGVIPSLIKQGEKAARKLYVEGTLT